MPIIIFTVTANLTIQTRVFEGARLYKAVMSISHLRGSLE
jgi:hypothetical protein